MMAGSHKGRRPSSSRMPTFGKVGCVWSTSRPRQVPLVKGSCSREEIAVFGEFFSGDDGCIETMFLRVIK